MTTDLTSRIDQLPPGVALHALTVLRGELTGDDVALRRALEDDPDAALAALAAAFPDVAPTATDSAALAKQTLALVARDASEERRALVEQALTAPTSKETLATPMEAAMLVSFVVLAMKSQFEVGYDKKKGFYFNVRKGASTDSLVKSVMSGLLGLFGK
jgi:hypothetical protein